MCKGDKMEKRQLKIWIDTSLAVAFRAACDAAGTSMTRELSGFMSRRTQMNAPVRELCAGTRGERRTAVRRIAALLACVRDAEERYMENIPENLQGGAAYEAAGMAVDTIDQAIAILEEAF
jgi:hypothetical protein